jgi:hypothetical protein
MGLLGGCSKYSGETKQPETASDLPLQAAQVYSAPEEGVNEPVSNLDGGRPYFVQRTNGR